MADPPPLALERSLAAAHAWWREAGVDCSFHDEPAAWLAPSRPDEVPDRAPRPVPTPAMREPAAAPPPPPLGGDRAEWPRDLTAFRDWWLNEPSLGESGLHPRLAPRGVAEAPLLMLVPMPEAEDSDCLLAGPQGRLLASLAQAMGLAPEAIYVAAALPRHTAMPDWDQLLERGLGEILRHHLALANPARIMVFGRRILPLLGHAPTQASHAVSQIDIDGRQKPLLATFGPDHLLGNARLRAGLWQCWLEWTDRDA